MCITRLLFLTKLDALIIAVGHVHHCILQKKNPEKCHKFSI